MEDKLLAKLISAIDDDFVKKVEMGIGYEHKNWDYPDPKKLCLTVLQTLYLLHD